MLLVVIGAIGLFGISTSNDALKTVYEDRTVALGQIADINRLYLRIRLIIANDLVNPVAEEIDKNTAEIDANIATITRVWAAYMATYLTPEEAQIAKKLDEDRATFMQAGLLPTLLALRAHDYEGAKHLVQVKIRPLYTPVLAGIDALMNLQLTEARSISRPLNKAVMIAHAIAQGNLNQAIETDGNNELSQLLQALSAMQDQLAQVVSTVRQGSESVATASAEIASGNLDLSARTEQQASALQQTAASMEELSVTVRQNADSAAQAKQLAQSASATAINRQHHQCDGRHFFPDQYFGLECCRRIGTGG